MYKGKKIFGLIPARGGSKGIPHKNLYPLQGKPLIQHTIDAAKASLFLDKIYCSTNDSAIATECRKHACAVIDRPSEYAQDTSPTIESVVHALNVLKARGEHYDYMLLLQPTSPLRTTKEIDGIIQNVIDNHLPSAVSVHKIPFNPILMRHMNTAGELQKCLSGTSTVRRQDMKETFYVNGSLYLISCADINTQTSFNDFSNGYEINAQHALDIDTLSDLIECQKILQELTH